MSRQHPAQWPPYQQPPYPYPTQPQGKQSKPRKKQQHKKRSKQPVKKSQWEHFKELLTGILLIVIGAILAYAYMTGGAA